MAIGPWTNCQVFAGTFDATGRSNQVMVDTDVDVHDVTTFASGGWNEYMGGLKRFSVETSGFQDFNASVDDAIGFTAGEWTFTAGTPITVATSSTAHAVTYFGPTLETNYTPVSAKVGDMAVFNLSATGQSTSGLVRGYLALPKTSVTSTATGTSTSSASLGTQSGKQIRGFLHVFAVVGSGSVTFAVESSADGVSSWTNRKNFAAATAVGSQFVTDTTLSTAHAYWRITCTAYSGFTSVTAAAGFGFVNP
jgi:predicted secreted protein